ncbi:MAG: RNase adapter RapZ [Tenuifilaceae bacterium]
MNQSLNIHIEVLSNLFFDLYKYKPLEVNQLPRSGSSRIYYRLKGNDFSVIGAFNNDAKENQAFFELTRHFIKKGLNVPSLLAISDCKKYYLTSDLGDLTLFAKLSCRTKNSLFDDKMMNYFKLSLAHLVNFQTIGASELDFSNCYPKSMFDRRSVMWDFNYFKYSFLKPSGVVFDEDKLEDDFESFTSYLLNDEMNYFQYRDFQSRNIMMKDEVLYFIDYQGGRRGPCLYDVASFLYQAKAAIPQSQRDLLFNYYLEELNSKRSIEVELLKKRFPAFVLFRIIQTLGAYGYRGYFEGKAHFLQSIPPAIDNLKQILSSNINDINIKYLAATLSQVIDIYKLKFEQSEPFDGLTIDITSFSLKNSYPVLNPEHGGGFIFDCRALQNPGRLAKYKDLTGLDKPVIEYLDERPEVDTFLNQAHKMILDTVLKYKERGFSYLSVGFGCTGGQHRSVYCAAKLTKMLEGMENVKINLLHRELINR